VSNPDRACRSLVDSGAGTVAFPTDKGSGSVTSFSQADGFIEIDALAASLDAGSEAQVTLIGSAVVKPTPLITTVPPVGTLPFGEILVIEGEGSVYVKPLGSVAVWPSGLVTVTSRLVFVEKSNGPTGVVAVIELAFTTFPLPASIPPIVTVAPLANVDPEIVIDVPPMFEPLDGDTEVTVSPGAV